jgi:hypothetical protein
LELAFEITYFLPVAEISTLEEFYAMVWTEAFKLHKGKGLVEMMNNILPFINGYDHDPREIYAIFGNRDTDALRIVYLCYVKSLDSLAVKDRPIVQVAFDPLEVLAFISKQVLPMDQLRDRAGMTYRQIEARTHSIFQYFGLPSTPPRS